MRKPRVGRHVGHYPRPVDKFGLGADDKQSSFREEGDKRNETTQRPGQEGHAGKYGVHGLPLDGMGFKEVIAEEKPPGGDGKGYRHVNQLPLLPVCTRGSRMICMPLGSRLPDGIGTASERKRPEEKADNAYETDGLKVAVQVELQIGGKRGYAGCVGQEPVSYEKGMGSYENKENRCKKGNRLLHAPHV